MSHFGLGWVSGKGVLYLLVNTFVMGCGPEELVVRQKQCLQAAASTSSCLQARSGRSLTTRPEGLLHSYF